MNNFDRTTYLDYASAMRHPGNFSNAITTFFAQDADINIVHPFNIASGAQAYFRTVIEPLQTSFESLYRRDDIAMTGDFEGTTWVSSTGYYVGQFARDWIGIRATHQLCYLRFGEFHRMEDGKAIESYIFFDIPELMIACGQWPIDIGPGLARGYTGMMKLGDPFGMTI